MNLIKSFFGSRKVAAFIDYDNIKDVGILQGKIVDFKKLHKLISEFGEICFAFIFIPQSRAHAIPTNLYYLGFDIVLCQNVVRDNSNKLEDKVDINIIQFGMKFAGMSDITDIVIVSDDGHMVHLVREACNAKKTVHIVGTNEMSKILKEVNMGSIQHLPVK